MKSVEEIRQDYKEWKEKTLHTLNELCSQPGAALGAAAGACGERDAFIHALFDSIDTASFRGNFTDDVEVSPDLILKWLDHIRADEVWTGEVSYARQEHPSLEDFCQDTHMDALRDFADQSFDFTMQTLIDNLRKQGLRAAVEVIDENSVETLASNDGKNIKIAKDASIGIFGPWVGGGSLMSVRLEKDIILPKSMINRIQVEGVKNSDYTVDEVYGLVGTFWTGHAMSATDEEAFVMTEDMVAEDCAALDARYPQFHEDDDDDGPRP